MPAIAPAQWARLSLLPPGHSWPSHHPTIQLPLSPQLNIRKLREDARLRPINIICQKLGASGMTRFEDRHRLPLGMTVNFTSYAAKMLGQVGGRAAGGVWRRRAASSRD